ncbi:hypothetical protein VV02_21865 [Luteipulveratus mongoliensis]|uniref:Uncharacterized protein n=1 Tax=Luteipulveratus mongoliensis TaxID=571913 RepID=A0A0K1JMD8_9MICO|nr:hypothetical protein VV02_21865 [Luteipulveratus mongoliensis]
MVRGVFLAAAIVFAAFFLHTLWSHDWDNASGTAFMSAAMMGAVAADVREQRKLNSLGWPRSSWPS